MKRSDNGCSVDGGIMGPNVAIIHDLNVLPCFIYISFYNNIHTVFKMYRLKV